MLDNCDSRDLIHIFETWLSLVAGDAGVPLPAVIDPQIAFLYGKNRDVVPIDAQLHAIVREHRCMQNLPPLTREQVDAVLTAWMHQWQLTHPQRG